MSGASMFSSSIIFEHHGAHLAEVFRSVATSLTLISIPCAIICLGLFFGGRQWFSAPPVNTFVHYVLATILYGATGLLLLQSQSCEKMGTGDNSHLIFVAYGFFQNSCRGLIILLQVQMLRGSCFRCGSLIVVLTSLIIGAFSVPNSVTELCRLGPSFEKKKPLLTSLVTGLYLVLMLVIKWRLTRAEANALNSEDQSFRNDASFEQQVSEVPAGDAWSGLARPHRPVRLASVTATLWISLTVRVSLQTVLGLTVKFSMLTLEGGLLQSLIIEHMLEHSQLFVATLLLLFHDEVNKPAKCLVHGEDVIEVLPMSDASPEVRARFETIKDAAVSLSSTRRVRLKRHRRAVSGSQIVSLLVQHEPQTRAAALQHAKQFVRYSFLKQLNEPSNVFRDSGSSVYEVDGQSRHEKNSFSLDEVCLTTLPERAGTIPEVVARRGTHETELSRVSSLRPSVV